MTPTPNPTTPQTVPITGTIYVPYVQGLAGRDGQDGARGPQGPPGPAGLATGETDVTTIGLTHTGVTNAELLAADYAKRVGPVSYFFPAGDWPINRTVRLGGDGVAIRGAGKFLTSVTGAGGYAPFVFGVTEAAADGFTVGPDARPDAVGVLDRSIVGGAGWAFGFRTQGRTSVYLTCHGLGLGTLDKTNGWDYRGGWQKITVRYLLAPPPGGRLPATGALFGVGGDREGGVPAPHTTGFWLDASPGVGQVLVQIRCEGDPPGATRRGLIPYNDPTKPHRFAWGIDLAGGRSFGMVDGVTVPIQWEGTDGHFQGKTLEKCTADYPWQFGLPGLMSYAGSGVAVPDVTLYGLAEYADYLPDPPANDKAAYLDASPASCIGLFRSDVVWPGRTLYFTTGPAAGGLPAEALLLDTLKGNAIQSGAAVSDLTIEKGAPGLLFGVGYDQHIDRVRCRGGIQGVASVRMGGGSYYSTIRDSECSGSECGLSLFETIGTAEAITVRQAGATSVRLSSTSMAFTGVMLAGFAPSPENAVRIYGAPGYGNVNSVTHLFADNESGSAFTRAVIEADQAPSTPTALTLRSIAANTIAANATMIRLAASVGAEQRPDPYLDAAGIFTPPNCAGLLRIDGPPGLWAGTITTTSPTRNAMGTGYDPARLKVVSP